MFLLKKILVALILPPTGLALLALFGLWLSRSRKRGWQRTGVVLCASALLALIVLSMPFVGNALNIPLQARAPVDAGALRQAQAIVILGGGTYFAAPEYGGDTVGRASLERARYGAKLGRETGLPLLVTSGAPFGGRAEAELMREVLEREFGVKVRWTETASRDTAENARLSAPILKAAGITRIALVTGADHMPRAEELFTREGLAVIAAPTAFSTASPSMIENLLPQGMGSSRHALHEYLGILFNRLKDALQ